MKKILIWILFIFIFVSFATLFRNPLLNDDAALYALAAKNAVIHNQWLAQFVTPGDLQSFLDKPPLGIWMLAIIPKIIGVSELTIHSPNMLYFCGMLLLLYFSLAKLASKRIALYATLISATSLALVVYARTPKLDIPITLFLLAAHLALYAFLKKDKPKYLYAFSVLLALGFLVKTGFGVLPPVLTLIGLFIFNPDARKKLLKYLFSYHSIFCLLILIVITGGVLGLQALALKGQWLAYLKSITIQSKYNIGYLGFGFNYQIIGILLITLFPWMPLFLSSAKIKFRVKTLNLHTLALIWFWSNFIFLLLFYNQTDFRTFTMLVPPLAILAAYKLHAIFYYKKTRKPVIAWSIFYTILFSLILIALILNPQNAQGISMVFALVPIAFFVMALLALTIFFWKPTSFKLGTAFALICLAYAVLFFNTEPLAKAFNSNATWPGIVKEHKEKDYAFYIYRPRDRKLFMSPDLFYIDFISGPADKYFWQAADLKKNLNSGKVVLLSDTQSYKNLNLRGGKILAQDSYSSLILH